MAEPAAPLFTLKSLCLQARNSDSPALNWTWEEEQCWLLVGPLDAGKTTLIKTLAGLIRPASGRLFWRNRCWWDSSGSLRQKGREEVGLVLEQHGLIETISAMENLLLPIVWHQNVSIAQAKEEAQAFIAPHFGLPTWLEHPTLSLSQSQKMWLSLIRALLRRPDVLLVDAHTPITGQERFLTPALAQYIRTQVPGFLMVAHPRLCHRWPEVNLLALWQGKLWPAQGGDRSSWPESLQHWFEHEQIQ